MLKPELSRARQARVLKVLQERKLDAVVIGLRHHVYYLTAYPQFWQHEAALLLMADGRSWLTTANSPAKNVAADTVVSFEANWNGTLRQEQAAVIGAQVTEVLRSRRIARIGFDASAIASQVLAGSDITGEPIDESLWQLRRRKDSDELELIQRAIECTGAMYRTAREVIVPGYPEVEMFAELQKAAVVSAGEPLSALLGNDYQYGSGGGSPRNGRVAKAGEICQLDLGPAYRGYFSDNARCIAVDRKPTDEQLKVWTAVMGALAIVEKLAKPGVRCQDLFTAVDQHFRETLSVGMPHHLGHGIGLQPHEFPHLNMKWDDTLIEGEIFTAEPGQYIKETVGGLRLENDYLVTATGVKNLSDFPMELA